MMDSIRLIKKNICNDIRRRLSALGVLTLALAGLTGGCAPFTTYPPDSDTGLKIYPWMAPCPEVMAKSLREVHSRISPDTPLVYNLPAGMTATTWTYVQNRLGPDARTMVDGDTRFLDLQRFGIRNTSAFADISLWNDGDGFLVTVTLERDNVLPFKVTNLQRFYITMSEPLVNAPVEDSDESASEDEAGGEK